MGQLRSPDAYVIPHKTAELVFTNYMRREANSFTENKDYEYVPMGMVNVGLFDRVCIGAWGGDRVGFVNLKVKVIEETVSIPQVSVGADNIFSPVKEDAGKIKPNQDYFNNPDKVFYEKNSPYIVFSKASVVKGMTGLPLLETIISIGMGGNKFKGQVSLAKKFEGIFGSISIKPQKDLSLTFENDGFNLNAGAQYAYKKFTFKVSYVGIEEQENNRIGFGIAYFFDKFSDSKQRPSMLFDDDTTSPKGSDSIQSPIQGKEFNANRDLLEELKKLREQREQTQKVLDELTGQLKEIDEDTAN
jgi:hypothetical protein